MSRNDVMLDLEFLGGDIDGLITTIGAVHFDIKEGGSIKSEFSMNIDIQDSLNNGRTIGGDVLKWWFTQPPETAQEMFKNTAPLNYVLQQFKDWLPPAPIIWGNGPMADIAKLEHAYGHYNVPWDLRKVRCYRTLRDIGDTMGIDYFQYVNDNFPNEQKHVAVADAAYQARVAAFIYSHIKKDE